MRVDGSASARITGADPSTLIFENASRTTAQTVTIRVTQDDTALAFTSNATLADSQWRIVSISASGIGVTQPDTPDGTLRVVNPTGNSGSFTVTVAAQDSFGDSYTREVRVQWSQAFEAVPEIELTFSDNTTIAQNTDGTYSHSSTDVYIRVLLGTVVVARAAREVDFNTSTGAFSLDAVNPAHPDGNLNVSTITVTLVNGGEFQVEYTG